MEEVAWYCGMRMSHIYKAKGLQQLDLVSHFNDRYRLYDDPQSRWGLSCLDVLLTFGAYSTARGMVISRLFIRFFWFGLSSVFVTYIYMKVLKEKITGTQILSIFRFITGTRSLQIHCTQIITTAQLSEIGLDG
ncbi:uncharacterized protein LOC131232425 [Magnolia sinica]|uniref:uncharacterized protein LOC131232425 n=1 Tax=Magnolia sinica TaxID=86752 RepID=UPI00265AAE0C|nr:uncharacterized protein LOC131232425 [Magnolia sinica]